jgi:putative membrane protein
MSTPLLVAGSIVIGVAALVHVFIFYLESISWSSEGTWRRFGVASQSDADTLKPMAYNQGFYNAFLAVGALAGIILTASESYQQAGLALQLFTALCMTLAATVLVISTPKLARAALLQGILPIVGIVLLLVGIAA